MNIRLATIILEKIGHTVVAAENGERGVESFKNGNYDLILMDMQRPIMDRLSATKAIRAIEKKQPSPSHIPIIAMTANAMTSDKLRCLDAGMDDYMTKPIKIDKITATLNRVLD